MLNVRPKVQIRLTKAQIEAARVTARRDGTSVSQAARKALDRGLLSLTHDQRPQCQALAHPGEGERPCNNRAAIGQQFCGTHIRAQRIRLLGDSQKDSNE